MRAKCKNMQHGREADETQENELRTKCNADETEKIRNADETQGNTGRRLLPTLHNLFAPRTPLCGSCAEQYKDETE